MEMNMETINANSEIAMDGIMDLSFAGICGKVAGALVGGVGVKAYEETLGNGKKLSVANAHLASANEAAKQAQVAAVVTLATTVLGFGAWGLKKAFGKYQADTAAKQAATQAAATNINP